MSLELDGTLFTYGPYNRLLGFISGHKDVHTADAIVIFVAGLTDGMLSKPYLPHLSNKLQHIMNTNSNVADNSMSSTCLNVSLIQLTLGSSYLGYGVSSLCQDVSEIDMAIDSILAKIKKSQHTHQGNDFCPNSSSVLPVLFLLGHSTGCQDAIHYSAHGHYRALVKGVILQGPVSDREYAAATQSMPTPVLNSVVSSLPVFVSDFLSSPPTSAELQTLLIQRAYATSQQATVGVSPLIAGSSLFSPSLLSMACLCGVELPTSTLALNGGCRCSNRHHMTLTDSQLTQPAQSDICSSMVTQRQHLGLFAEGYSPDLSLPDIHSLAYTCSSDLTAAQGLVVVNSPSGVVLVGENKESGSVKSDLNHHTYQSNILSLTPSLMPMGTDMGPITLQRYLSLNTKLGNDDMFSSDLSETELIHCYRGLHRTGCYSSPHIPDLESGDTVIRHSSLNLPVSSLWLLSGQDEYLYSHHTISCMGGQFGMASIGKVGSRCICNGKGFSKTVISEDELLNSRERRLVIFDNYQPSDIDSLNAQVTCSKLNSSSNSLLNLQASKCLLKQAYSRVVCLPLSNHTLSNNTVGDSVNTTLNTLNLNHGMVVDDEINILCDEICSFVALNL